jgi:hypothetical protein
VWNRAIEHFRIARQVITMNAPQTNTPAPLRPAVDSVDLACTCGQDLDRCQHQHCPWCGASTAGCQARAEHLERRPLGWVA